MSYNFDRVSDQYDATRGMPPRLADRISRWVLSRLPANPAITELGVGTGRIALPFIEQGVKYTGFDISEQMTARLVAKLGGNLRNASLVLADITEPLPLADQSQDAVIAVHILHLVDALKALAQVRRVLRPHGALVWGFEHHDDLSPRQRIRQYFRDRAGELSDWRPRDFFAQPARQQLAEWGAQVTRHTVAAWTSQENCREVLESLRDRVMSFTWDMPEVILQAAYARTEAWAKAEYGDLDRVHEIGKEFRVDWYQF